jgi:hypothetical protein
MCPVQCLISFDWWRSAPFSSTASFRNGSQAELRQRILQRVAEMNNAPARTPADKGHLRKTPSGSGQLAVRFECSRMLKS